ncbi:MAG TPA: HAMP domain-containing sensor histidine kinase [Soehngenia sp.]|nr:HAMP domain-containing sensor histidine kinase [Soehngenia sp.]HPP31584.1 HAMP domain-containing sensor histidine kinase [Soehngenia sp.]
MSIRKLLLILLLGVCLITVVINSSIFASLTDKYFLNYLDEAYEKHLEQISRYLSTALTSKDLNYEKLEAELETHLLDPIVRIRVFKDDNLLADVEAISGIPNANMKGKMNMRMALRRVSTETTTDVFEIKNGDEIIGTLYITRFEDYDSSIIANMFRSTLFINSLISISIAMLISAFIALITSRKISTDLRYTSHLASQIQQGKVIKAKDTKIKEINSLRNSLEDLSVKLKLKQKAKKELLDQLIHETRTPLTVLNTHFEAIEDGIIESDHEEIEVLKSQVENLTFIISNLNRIIEDDDSGADLKIEEVEINKLIKQIASGLKNQFENKKIHLTIDNDEDITIFTDKYKFTQILFNLLTNAYKYTEPYKNVNISYKIENDKFILEVKDQGKGIREEETKKIFNAYYRGLNETEQGEGIGLYIVKENVESLGGEVKVRSKVGEGSVFTVILPLNIFS